MSEESYKKYRPKLLKDVLGQDEAVSVVKGMLATDKIPHSILLTGPSGVGKTTIAYIIKDKLKCHDRGFEEINAADYKGIDMIRKIRKEYERQALAGGKRVYLIDEAHGLTTEAQNAFLKMLEDTPEHVYFILATTDPGKLLPTIKTRCTLIALKPLPITKLKELVKNIAAKLQLKISNSVVDALIGCAGGSARQVLNDLDRVAAIKDKGEDAMLEVLTPETVKATAMTIVNTLIPFKGRGNWQDAANAIHSCEDDVEKVRQIVLSCAANQLRLGGKFAHRAYLVIVAFSEPFFHSRKAGMLAAAWEVFNSKQ